MKKLRLVLTVERVVKLADQGVIELLLPNGVELDVVLPDEIKVFYNDESGNPVMLGKREQIN